MNILISGGCKNGKSYHAQVLARQAAQNLHVPLYYLATMIPVDEEDQARIRRHLAERAGWGFTTIERGRDILGLLRAADTCRVSETGAPVDLHGVFLLDSVTALLSNEMFPPGDSAFDANAAQRVAAELCQFALHTGNTIFVSDYLYADPIGPDQWTETYRAGLATVDRALAATCDAVIEVTYGITYYYKGGPQ